MVGSTLYHNYFINNMYLRSQPMPDPSVLQLTGQLTIVTHPTHLQPLQHLQNRPQYHPYTKPSYTDLTPLQPGHYQALRQPLSAQYPQEPQEYPQHQLNHPPQHLRPKPPKEQPMEDEGEQTGGKESAKKERLQGRVNQANISKVNCQTLRAFRDICLELIDRMTAQDQAQEEKMMKRMEEMESKLEKKGQEFLERQERRKEEEEKKLDSKMQELEERIKEGMKELLEQKRVQAEKLRQEKFHHFNQQMNRHQTSTKETVKTVEKKMKEMQEKMKIMEAKMKRKEGEVEKLEDGVQLKIKEEINRLMLLKKALTSLHKSFCSRINSGTWIEERFGEVGLETLAKEAEKRSQEQIKAVKNQLHEHEKEASEKPESPKAKENMMEQTGKPEYCVMHTPSAQCFTINHNITRCSGEDLSYRMVLLNAVVGEGAFSFRTCIHQRKGPMWIGVTDRVTQKERNSAQLEHSIKYNCCYGYIFHATGDGKYKSYENGVSVDEGMELVCKVEKEKCQVTFTVIKQGQSKYRRAVHSPHPQLR